MPKTIVTVVQELGRGLACVPCLGGPAWLRRLRRLRRLVRTRKRAAALALAGLLGAGLSATASAQAPAHGMPAKSYMNKAPFYLPVTFDEKLRPTLKEVLLYVKEGPDRPWMLKEKVPPTQSWFTVRPQQDGEYWFTVVTVDQAGRSNPANIATAPPGLVVILDTQAPRVDVANVAPSADGQCVHCSIQDANHDQRKTKFLYQTADGMWRSGEAVPGRADAFCIPKQAMHTGMVQVVAADFAGNLTKRELNSMSRLESASTPGHKAVGPGAGPMMPVVPNNTAKNATAPALPSEDIAAKKRSEPQELTLPSQPPLLPSAMPAMGNPDMRKVQTVQPKGQVVPAVQQVVNNPRLMLEYQIEQMGQSGVGKVEVWLTRDKGQTWQRHAEDVDRKSPIEVNLPGEGRFGISLVVSNGRGFGGNVPKRGDTPDYCVEVDVTNPTADILGVRPESGNDGASLLITWAARDANLAAEPIDLYYGANATGPWTLIAKGVRNDGQFSWIAPRDLSHAHVRLVVHDAAGNSTSVETSQPIALDDLSRPRGRVVSVTPTTSNGIGLQGN
jgi:hypothetical protein